MFMTCYKNNPCQIHLQQVNLKSSKKAKKGRNKRGQNEDSKTCNQIFHAVFIDVDADFYIFIPSNKHSQEKLGIYTVTGAEAAHSAADCWRGNMDTSTQTLWDKSIKVYL